MKTPDEVKNRRSQLERELEELDNIEQAWGELTREQRLTELIHKAICNRSHGERQDYCKFHTKSWATPSSDQTFWLRKATNLIATLPEELDDIQILEIVKASREIQ